MLGRLGISSLVSHLDSLLEIKPPILPACLGLAWYLISRLRSLEPLGSNSQSWLDQKLLGSSHLHNPTIGFDPEGMLASFLTVPISSLVASYLARPYPSLATMETGQLAALGLLGALLTGVIPSPTTKILWTPTYVGQTTSISLIYWSLARALASRKHPITLWISKALEVLGRRSLEIYVISACCSQALVRIGTWDSMLKVIDQLLAVLGIPNESHHRQVLAGVARSSLLGALMIPMARLMLHFDWKL